MTLNFLLAHFEELSKCMMNGLYFIVIAFLFAELFKILCYANEMTCDVTLRTQNDVLQQNTEYLCI